MAATCQENDVGRVRRWGKEFLADWEAGTGGGTGRGQHRSDAAAGPQGEADKMTARTARFNPPPGWQPDPSWPAPPPGWHLWAGDRPAISPKAQGSLLAMAGGIAVVLGSMMPWVSFNSVGMKVKPVRGNGRNTRPSPAGQARVYEPRLSIHVLWTPAPSEGDQ
jgi:hypothetical protein